MKCICERFASSFEIKKSEFICVMIPLKDDKDVSNILSSLKKEYPKATHYCYGYRAGMKEKSCDDGEPSGTAGRPILEFLKNNDLTDILCVVIRYFGGIKLGASGLLRAYVDSCKETYKKAILYSQEYMKKYKVEIDYTYYEHISRYLEKENAKIIKSDFEINVVIIFLIKELDISVLSSLTNGNIKTDYLGEEMTLEIIK